MGKQHKPLKARGNELAQALITLKGKRLSFEKYRPFKLIYDVQPKSLTLKCGRQVGKSVSLGGILTMNSASIPHFNSLYVSPSSTQTKRFSTAYLNPFLSSPLIKKQFTDKASTANVYEKSFTNQSRIYLSYGQNEQDADRMRGIMSDQVFCDEIQDISYSALPVILEVMSASEYQFERYTGTSKNSNNTLEYLFRHSNQLEWVMKCEACGKHIIPYDNAICMRIVSSREGPVCPYCNRVIDVTTGQWIPMRPEVTDHFGFHIPQFIVSANTSPKKWAGLYDKITRGVYNRVKINNEVFGLADEAAGKSLSMSDAQRCCNNDWQAWDEGWPHDSRGIISCVMGIDWSVTNSTKSYTVVTILGFDYKGKAYVLYSYRFKTGDPLQQVEDIAHLVAKYNVQLVSADRGVGVLQCQLLQQKFGKNRVIPVNYVSASQKLRYDQKNEFLAADRTQAMDHAITKIRMGRDRFETPSWSVSSSYWQDALNVHEEETLNNRRVYRHDPELTDDWIHSIVFAEIGHQVLTGDFTIG